MQIQIKDKSQNGEVYVKNTRNKQRIEGEYMSKIKDYAEQVYGEEYPDLTQGDEI